MAIFLKSFVSDIAVFLNKPFIIYFWYSYSGFFFFTMRKTVVLENCVFMNCFIFWWLSGYLSDLYRIFTFHIRTLSFLAMLRMVNKIKTLTLLSMKNKIVDLSLGVSNVIDITELLFAFLIKFLPHLMEKYWKPWM